MAFSTSSQGGGAPATSAFTFSSSAAPAGGAAPAAPAFGAAAAPTGGLFSSNKTAPAPAFGGAPAFGAAPAAPGVFGSAPAPSTGGLFGTTPTPPPSVGAFGSTPSVFGSTPTAVPVAAQTAVLSGQTPYASLPPDAKRAFDTIHEQIMRHRRTMIQVQTMAPALLRVDSREVSASSPADKAAGVGNSDSTPLPMQLTALQLKIQEVKEHFDKCRTEALSLRKMYETSATQAVMYGTWPIAALAVRRGVKLSASETKKDPTVQNELKALLEQRAATVDRVERVPSPYMWELLQDFETRLLRLEHSIFSFQSHLKQSQMAIQEKNASPDSIALVVQQQGEALRHVEVATRRLHEEMDRLRQRYRHYEKGENVLDKANVQEAGRERRIYQEMRIHYVKAAPSPAAGPTGTPNPPSAAPATTTFGAFGSTTAPSPGVFGGAPTPAPGGLFGGAPTPAPGLFGASTTPAPSAFGSTAAPATGGLFGSTTAASAPTPGPFSTVSTPKSKSKNRSSRRHR